ncbi:type VI secretion system-associated FHA domain protein TagH [Methylobacterium oryzae]|uniref:type VI secretion system-associated FHA domain protein TagH n=1 Tax=Methylobacterium oryzae TaxID=334852 RepID=UPI002F34F8C4
MTTFLTLVVDNTALLEGGTRSSMVFPAEGGLIGSAADCTWTLIDRLQTVDGHHARVFQADGQFCVEALSTRGVRVNHSVRALGPGEPFRISDADRLSIGRFDMTAFLIQRVDEASRAAKSEDWARKFISVESIVDPRREEEEHRNLLDETLVAQHGLDPFSARLKQNEEDKDPLSFLADRTVRQGDPVTSDPVAALNRESPPEGGTNAAGLEMYVLGRPIEGQRPESPDDLLPTSAYFAPQRVKDTSMKAAEHGRLDFPLAGIRDELDSYLGELENNMRDRKAHAARGPDEVAARDAWLGEVPLAEEREVARDDLVDHVVLRPLCAALGLPVTSLTGPEADRLAADIGEALRAAIDGLRRLSQDRSAAGVLASDTHLHAIEDNPLRLAGDADEAVRDLFLVHSPVHLSAKTAIGESIASIEHHQAAAAVATEAALKAIFAALSPVTLARRFLKYKGHVPRTGDLDAWHWGMYQHYYREIASDRQGGLARLFWEVFRQVHDREMRTLSAGE